MDRWDRLFADLEAEAAAEQRAELFAEVSDRTRREVGQILLGARIRSAVGSPLRIDLVTGRSYSGVVRGAGPDWLLLGDAGRPADDAAVDPLGSPAGSGGGRTTLLALAAVTGLSALGRTVAPPPGPVEARTDLRFVLRGLVRDRRPVLLGTTAGHDHSGTIDRVGADFLDLAVHPLGEARRAGAVVGVLTVPLVAVAWLRLG